MEHKLIKTENYLLVVDDSEIKESRLRYIFDNRQEINGFIHQVSVVLDSKLCPEIIAHLPLNNSLILEGVDLLPPLEDDVEKLAELNGSPDSSGFYDYKEGFVDGYYEAKEKYKYTEEDILIIRNKLVSMLPTGDVSAWDMIMAASNYTKWFDEYIQSLQQPKYPVAFECEMEYKDMVGYWYKVDEITKEAVNRFDLETRPKTITNSQGITQWVGTYKYE
jgi:hypothetical protein